MVIGLNLIIFKVFTVPLIYYAHTFTWSNESYCLAYPAI